MVNVEEPEPSPNDKMLLVSQSEVSTVLAFNKQLQFTPRESFEIFFGRISNALIEYDDQKMPVRKQGAKRDGVGD